MPVGSEVKAGQAEFPPVQDGLLVLPRGDRYGGQWVSSASAADFHHAESGALILATNPTTGTGQTWVAAQTTFSDTAPNWYIENPSTDRTLWLRSLKMICSAVGTAAVAWRLAVVVDTVLRAFTTDNTQLVTPFSPGPKPLIVTPKIKVQNSATVSVITASNASARKTIQATIGGLNIASDELECVFGGVDASGFTGVADAAGQPSRKVSSCPPIGIPPGGSGVIHIWAPSSSASINPEWVLALIAR